MRKCRLNKTVISAIIIICITGVICSLIFVSANVDIFGVLKSKYAGLTGNNSVYYTKGPMTITQVDASAERRNWMDITEEVLPSVVYIENHSKTSISAGSGVIMSANGYIVTNYHVIDAADKIYVQLFDDKRYEAHVVGGDKYTDLAVIKIDALGLKPAVFGDSSKLRAAEPVLAVGNPGGSDFKFSVTEGIVSALDRPMDLGYGYTVYCIQTDAAINPGNSGGALFNQYGQVIGINSAKISATEYEGLGFAITSMQATPIINELCENGSVARALLGISGKIVAVNETGYGMEIAGITNASITAVGIAVGDIIVEIDGNKIKTTNTINTVLQSKKPGDIVTLKVYSVSGKKYITEKVTLVSNKV